MDKPCQNGATCIDGIQSYKCECENGFEGKTWFTEDILLMNIYGVHLVIRGELILSILPQIYKSVSCSLVALPKA